MGGGTVLDLGIYVLQFSQMIFGCEPLKVVAAGHLNDDGVDQSMSCVMTYPNGGTATLSTHSKVALPCEARVTGTKGTTMVGLLLNINYSYFTGMYIVILPVSAILK